VLPAIVGMRDLNLREIGALAPLLLLILVLGLFPKPLLDVINPSVERTMTQVDKADPQPKVTEGEAAK
jgi:NADH-quinone oxidoreductase subunit M